MWMRYAFVYLLLLFVSGCTMLQPVLHRSTDRVLHRYGKFTTDSVAVKNLNADPYGDPWMVGGLILPGAREFASYPALSFGTVPRALQLPERVDNAKQKYWRGIFAQKHGSCAQASGIAYVYTYEVNRLRGRNADDPHDRYPTHWTYNFVNKGYDRGSWMMWGWEVGKSLGIPNAKLYGTETGYDLRYWPSDYAVYENAIDNKIDSYFVMDVGSAKGIDQLKRYLYDHGIDGGEGGILSFAAGWSENYKEAKLPADGYEGGKKAIISFGKVVNHAVTFVGYDDKVCYDFNGDGQCTNDIDLNGDEKIDVRDWEQGAFIMANSWGTGWGDDGFIYVPYRLAALSYKEGGIYMSTVYGVTPAADEPKGLVARVRMRHDKRSKLRFLSQYRYAESDDKDGKLYRYYGLQNSGGEYPLNGKDSGAVTFGLDLRRLLKGVEIERVSDLNVVLDSLGGIGTVETMEVIDYVDGRVVTSDQQDISIDKGRTVVTAAWQDGDPDPDPEPQPCNVAPIAQAGYDLTVNEYCIQIIDGSGSLDLDGEIVSYRWTQRYGRKKLELENADTAKVTVYIPKVDRTEYFYLMLTVTDDTGMVATDTMRLVVRNR
jgi:hypothetical protein